MSIETLVAGTAAEVGPLNSNFSDLDTRVTTLNATVLGHTTSISTLNTTVNGLVYIPAELLSTTAAEDGHKATLNDGKVYRLNFGSETKITLYLPATNTLLGNIYHQIVVLANIPEGKTLVLSNDLSNLRYFNGIAPNFSEAGKYTIIYEYDGANWVVGAVIKKAAS